MTYLSHILPISLEPRFATRFLGLPRRKNLVNQENFKKIMVQTKFGTIFAERERERENDEHSFTNRLISTF